MTTFRRRYMALMLVIVNILVSSVIGFRRIVLKTSLNSGAFGSSLKSRRVGAHFALAMLRTFERRFCFGTGASG